MSSAAVKRKAAVPQAGDENIAPNVQATKRTKAETTQSTSSLLKGVKSALPLPSKKTTTYTTKAIGTVISVPESSKTLNDVTIKKDSSVVNVFSASMTTAVPQITTSDVLTLVPVAQSSSSSSSSSSSESVTVFTANASSRVPLERIRTYFDESISVNEDKINIVLAALRPKPKRGFEDYKEKMKKQEAAIKDLQEILMKTLAELKIVRELSIAHESQMRCTIGEIDGELQTYKRQGAVLETSEARLKDELARLCQFTEKCKGDLSPLRNKSSSLENKCTDLTEKFFEEQSRRKRAEEDVVRLEKELREVSDNLASVRLQNDEKIEKSNASRKEELASMQAQLVQSTAEALSLNSKIGELREEMLRSGASIKEFETSANRSEQDASRLSSELERLKEHLQAKDVEALSLNSKIAEAREELLRTAADLRALENTANRSEQDANRLTSELERLRDQLQQKDADLRSSLAAVSDERRMANEEKTGSRAELSTLQSRIVLLEEERLQSTSELATKREELASGTREIAHLRDTILALETKLSSHDADILSAKEVTVQLDVERELRSRCEVREETERRERIAACAQLLATQTESNVRMQQLEEKATATVESLRAELVDTCVRRDAAIESARIHQEQAIQKEGELQHLRFTIENQQSYASSESTEQLGRVIGELEVLKMRLREVSDLKECEATAATLRIAELEERLKGFDDQRRRMHNLIQELRGNVRVYARVRPFLPSDGIDLSAQPNPSSSIAVRSDDMSLQIVRTANGSDRAEDHSFSFDRTFGPSSSQESVFQEVSEFVQSALDGYNVCLFSYGQTGSGKTHTMSGSGNGSMRGIIPRAIEQVGSYKTALEAKGWEYQMEVSYIEIYNETIRDLLRSGPDEDAKHEIKRDLAGNTTVTDVIVTSVDPNNKEQMDIIMEQAARNRSVEKTAMNDRSSRSHSVFTLHLRATNPTEGSVLKGTLSLVDLAGSERLDRSGATGARMKETVAINKSLSSLVDVFAAISNKQQHVPFRNSKLTYLLQPALSGDGKTLMLVNLSPTEESYFESLCSLRFASHVNQCELAHYGKPKKQVKDGAAAAAAAENSTPSAASNGSKVITAGNSSKPKPPKR